MQRFIIIILIPFIHFSIYSNQNQKKSELVFPDEKPIEGYWGEAESLETSKDLKIIEDISEEASTKKIENARKMFNLSLSIFKSSEIQIQNKKSEYEKEVNLEDKYTWQKKARENNREKELRKITIDARQNSIIPLVKGMNYLDKIENPIVKKSPIYIDLKASLFREYIKHQFALKSYNLAVDMLDRYIELSDKYEAEAEPHKILAACLEKQEIQASKYKKDALAFSIRSKKNHHLMRYTELAFGKGSNQYNKLAEKVSRE
ncbi:MAG: hypothetical protein L6Q54_01150 [Leptospiraceae bacterium]|nr:hypothetical protein [Leptospiraceae bacterium]MCK6379846.1 hypothetical protein [Leptospiraceae bacterium]NUM41660.1 hypothetical protein [Leptospiraceae bacterium]